MVTFSKEQWADILDGIKRSQRDFLWKPRKLQCNECAKQIRSIEKATCKVYPNGIPKQLGINEQECPEFQIKDNVGDLTDLKEQPSPSEYMQLDLFDLELLNKNIGKITYYNLDGTFHAEKKLTHANVGNVGGFMVRCTMKNGDIHEGFSSPFRKYDSFYNYEENHDLLYLWTWDNYDEETHQLIGDEETKYNTTYTPVTIAEIKSIDVILFSHPRWGGNLHNRFFIDIPKN